MRYRIPRLQRVEKVNSEKIIHKKFSGRTRTAKPSLESKGGGVADITVRGRNVRREATNFPRTAPPSSSPRRGPRCSSGSHGFVPFAIPLTGFYLPNSMVFRNLRPAFTPKRRRGKPGFLLELPGEKHLALISAQLRDFRDRLMAAGQKC